MVAWEWEWERERFVVTDHGEQVGGGFKSASAAEAFARRFKAEEQKRLDASRARGYREHEHPSVLVIHERRTTAQRVALDLRPEAGLREDEAVAAARHSGVDPDKLVCPVCRGNREDCGCT